MLPPQYRIDYETVFAAADPEDSENIADFLQMQLPAEWRKTYLATAEHQAKLVDFRCGSFEYICDLYSQLEACGEVPFNQTIQDRVVAVAGTSANAARRRAGRRWWSDTQEFLEERDLGHFIARSIGGGLDVNVFLQERNLNRGWSPQGKVYRQMERYCSEQPGTFCFSRPIYTDGSSIPRWLEFGLLRTDRTLWVEVFDN
jgi:hypothetical protein